MKEILMGVFALFVAVIIGVTAFIPVVDSVTNDYDLADVTGETQTCTALTACALTNTPVDTVSFVGANASTTDYSYTGLTGANGDYNVNGSISNPLTTGTDYLTVTYEPDPVAEENITVSINGNALGTLDNSTTYTSLEVLSTYLISGTNVVTFANDGATTQTNITQMNLTYDSYATYATTNYNVTTTGITTAGTDQYYINYDYHTASTSIITTILNILPLFAGIAVLLIVVGAIYTQL